jgi:branched-chain amino acid transport system permease protein
VGLVWKGARPVSVPDILPHGAVFTIGGVDYTWKMFFVLCVTVPTLVGLTWLVQRTRRGKAMRAIAQDREAAAMMGIDVNRTISFTFALAGCLAGIAGVVFALDTTNITFLTGFRTGLIAFTAAVLGGIGNLTGAVVGAMLIGLTQSFTDGLSWHSPGSAWTEAVVFGILILILVFRPEGLLGEQTPEGA